MSSDLWSLKGFAEASQSARTHAQSLLDKPGSFRLDTPKAQQLETSHVARHEMQKPHRSTQAIQVQDCLNLQFFARLRMEVQSCQEHHEDLTTKHHLKTWGQSHPQVTSCRIDFRGQNWAIQKLLRAVAKGLCRSWAVGSKEANQPHTILAIDLP